MGRPYPELTDSVPRIQTVVREEEEQFLRNLENGLKLLNDVFRKTKAAGSDTIVGRGRVRPPLDLRHPGRGHREPRRRPEPAGRHGRASRRPMEEFARISRGTTEAAAVFATGPLDTLKEVVPPRQRVPRLRDDRGRRARSSASSSRTGWPTRPTVEPGRAAPVVLVLDRTPFYGESGGQVGDTGDDPRRGVRLPGRRHEEGERLHPPHRPGDRGDRHASTTRSRAEVDADRREAIRRAHSATHVLHHALHIHLGKHAQQAGSKVEPDRLRFDFANPEAVGRDRLRADRGDGQRPRPRGRADLLDRPCRSPRRRPLGRDGPLRREVPRGRPRRRDGRVLPRALRRDAPRQRRPGRPVQDRRRGVGLGRHPADHRPDRQGRARPDPPGGGRSSPRSPPRSRSRPRWSPSGSRPCSRRSRPSRSRPRQRKADDRPEDLARRPARRRDRRRRGQGRRGRARRRARPTSSAS